MSDNDLYIAVRQYEQYGKIVPCGSCRYFRAYTDGTYGNCTRTVNHGAVYRKTDFCSYAELPLPAADDHDVSGLLDD